MLVVFLNMVVKINAFDIFRTFCKIRNCHAQTIALTWKVLTHAAIGLPFKMCFRFLKFLKFQSLFHKLSNQN